MTLPAFPAGQSYLQTITAARDALVMELQAETARRLTLVQAGNPPPATYQSQGRQVQWNEYVTMMKESIKSLNELLADEDLYEQHEHGYT